jgi:hypothetical protein
MGDSKVPQIRVGKVWRRDFELVDECQTLCQSLFLGSLDLPRLDRGTIEIPDFFGEVGDLKSLGAFLAKSDPKILWYEL